MDDKKDQYGAPGIRKQQLADRKPIDRHQKKREMKTQQLES